MKYIYSQKPLLLTIFCLNFLLIACKQDNTNKAPNGTVQNDPMLIALNEAIDKNPAIADLYFKRAQFYREKKGYDEALADLNSAIKLDSLRPVYYGLLSDVYLEYYQSRMALMTMQRASGLFPDSISVLMKLANLEMTLKKPDAAMQTLERIVTKDRQNAEARIMMGMALEASGDPARAMLAYRKATEMDPYLTDAWIKAGILADKMKLNDGMKYLQTAVKIDTGSYEANYALAMHFQQRHLDKEAMEIYRKLNIMYPKIAEPFYNMGALYLSQDSLDRALQFFGMATQIDQVYAEAYYAKGAVLERMNKNKEAYQVYNQAASIKPGYTQAEKAAARLKPEIK